MRLIDADAFNDWILSHFAEPQSALILTLQGFIAEQPTAYSVDEVVEELEERTDFLKDCTKYGNKNAKQQAKSYSTMMMYEVADLVDDLLEIVKQGGVSDDVCEAKQGKWIFDKFTAKYGNPYRCSCCNEEFGDTYNYCPNCGVSMN